MRKRKTLVFLFAAFILISALSGCFGAAPVNKTDTFIVTDMTGREIRLGGPADRIVAVSAADCEILYALGAGDLIVGRGAYCDYPEAVLKLPEVQSGADMNIEQIMALKPQIVLMSAMDQTAEQITALEAAGISVIVSDAQDIAGVYASIELIGKVTGKSAEAAELTDGMKQAFSALKQKSQNNEKTVYFEVSPLEFGLWTAGTGTFMDELADLLGVTNIFSDVAGWAEISEEQVIDRDPDYIVTITMYFGEGPTPVEEILARSGWESMKAIKSGNVINVDNNSIARPGPRLTLAAQTLSEFFSQ